MLNNMSVSFVPCLISGEYVIRVLGTNILVAFSIQLADGSAVISSRMVHERCRCARAIGLMLLAHNEPIPAIVSS